MAHNHSPRVVVIGGGFGGIAAGYYLQRAGIKDFTILERSPGLGGTWWDNRYPGAETDAASHLYCFSFASYSWSRSHVRQPELRDYLEHVVDRFALRRHFRFGHCVSRVEWDDSAAEQVITLADGEVIRADAVICAVGMFNALRWPELPGLERFGGPVLHTARWDDTVRLSGKRVAVIGTGSSACQVVPTLAGDAATVTVFQRQPGWLLPKDDRDFTPRERRLAGGRWAWKAQRLRLYLRQERREVGGAVFKAGSRVNGRMEALARAHIAEVFADRPELRAAVTPRYPFAGKRILISSAFYRALLRPDVELVPRAVTSCTPGAVVDAAGREHRVDALVLATGFQATGYLVGIDVVGREGRKLHDVWDGDAHAFLGLTVPGFPNFFMLYGPNTNGGFIISNLQRQAAYAVREILQLRRRDRVEVRADVEAVYNAWLQRRLAATAFTSTDNYFTTTSGKVVTQWPDCATLYAALTVALRRPSTWGRRRARAAATGIQPVAAEPRTAA